MDDDDNVVKMETRTVQDWRGSLDAREKKLATWAKGMWEYGDIIIGQNHLGFDRHFLNGVLFRYDLPILRPRILIDTYQTAKGEFAMGVSMSNMVDIWKIGSKDAPNKEDWRKANHGDKESLLRIKARCESDVVMTAALWRKLKPIYMERQGR